jgi:glycosyltransferase involved in cell wall biosynthesis
VNVRVPVSVVVPTFQRADLVCRALDSVLAQTRAPHDVVVVDDGSTDGTAERLCRYGDRIRVLTQNNAGGAVARNRGVAAAGAEWIAFLDSDDVWRGDHLQRLDAARAATGGAAALYFRDTARSADDGGGSLWQAAGFAIDAPFELCDDAMAWAMLPLQPIMLQSAMVARGAFARVGGFEPELTRRHDTHLFFKLALAGPFCAVQGVGVEFTADDRSGGRLTVRHDAHSRCYLECSVALYRDVLARAVAEPAGRRRELRARLAAAHWRLARSDWRAGRRAASLWPTLRSLACQPAVVCAAAARRLLAAGSGAEPGR